MKADNNELNYHGVQVSIIRDALAGDLQYEEVMAVVDKFIKNDKGEYLRKLTISINANEEIELIPVYSAPAIERIKEVR